MICPGMSVVSRKQRRDWHTQPARDPRDIAQRHIPLAALDRTEEFLMHARTFRELFLCPATGEPQFTHPSTEFVRFLFHTA